MLANVISTAVATVISVIVYLRYRQNGNNGFILFAVGFGILTYELLTQGRSWPTSVGIITLASAMVAVLADSLNTKK